MSSARFGDDVELPRWADLLKSRIAIFDLDFDAILSALYALSVSAEGDCYQCVPPDPGIAAAALGASASGTLPSTAPAEALHTFTLDSGASRCFFRDNTTLTPLPEPVPVRLADPSGGPVVARLSTVLPCPAVPSGSLSGLHLPSFSMKLVITAALQDAMVTTTTPEGQRVSIYTCTRTGLHLATFTRRPGSSLYTFATEPSQTLLWHHHLGHPSLPRLRGMHSRLLGHERYFLLVVDDYSRYTTLFPLRSKDRGGEFSSDLLRAFCRSEGIRQTFTLAASPQQNGIAERRIGMVMDVASDKLSSRAVPCVFLGFPPEAPGWQFYHPTSRRVLSSQDVTFDKSVLYYRIFPYRTASPPPGTPPVDPLPPQGPAPSGVSQVDPAEPVEVAVDSGAARGAELAGAGTWGAETGGAESGGGESGRAEPGSTEPGRVEPEGAPLSPQQLREWYSRCCRGAAGATGGPPGASGGAAGTGGTAGASRGAAGAGAVGGAVGAGGAAGPGAAGGALRPRPYYVPLLQQVLGSLPSPGPPPPPLLSPPPVHGLTERCEPESRPASPVRPVRAGRVSHLRPPPVPGTHSITLRPSTAPQRVPLPSPLASSLPAGPDPSSDSLRAASPVIV
ncbi:unnamed protein product [Closterium sp. NIES-53]